MKIERGAGAALRVADGRLRRPGFRRRRSPWSSPLVVADEAFFTLFLLTFPAVGFFVLSRRPDARLAWVMVSMGVAVAVLGPFSAYGANAIERDLPFGPLALAIGGPGWVPFIGDLRLPAAAVPRRAACPRRGGDGSRGRAASSSDS